MASAADAAAEVLPVPGLSTEVRGGEGGKGEVEGVSGEGGRRIKTKHICVRRGGGLREGV